MFTVAACGDSVDPTSPDTGDDVMTVVPAGNEPLASAFAGGIPFGNFAQPISQLGSIFNGSHENSTPTGLLRELQETKSRGGKVILALSGSPRYYKDGAGNFSYTKWKERVNRFRNVNFRSYIEDGTIVGHYLIDEPNDPANWNGKEVSASMVEEMAKYSKSIWPTMVTIVRAEPRHMGDNHRYLDAAWAQYLYRRGNVNEYIKDVVGTAQRKGLALVVGMNVLKGRPERRPDERQRSGGLGLRAAEQQLSLRLHQLGVQRRLLQLQQHPERHERPAPQGGEPKHQELQGLSRQACRR